jgi:hypothetical protein
LRMSTSGMAMYKSACRTKGTEAYSTPIYGVLARRQPQIFRCWSPGRGLCDRLKYVSRSAVRRLVVRIAECLTSRRSRPSARLSRPTRT